jgi:predicted DNA-binding transcriptional regulator AlpA
MPTNDASNALKRSVPRIALRADEAADALGIGVTTFLALVNEGKMPRPIYIRPRLPLYNTEDVRKFWGALKDAIVDSDPNPWDD